MSGARFSPLPRAMTRRGLDLLRSIAELDKDTEDTLTIISEPLDALADQVDHLESSLSALTAQHSTTNARLLSTLDSLDVLQASHRDALDRLQTERATLHNANLVLREELYEAKREAESFKRALQEELTSSESLPRL